MLNQKGFTLLVILLGILILGISFGGGYLLITKKLNVNSVPIYTPLPCHTKPNPNSVSTLRQVDIDSKFLGNQGYPREVINICDSELVAMDCTFLYTRMSDGNYTYNSTETTDSGTKSVSLRVTQEDILDNISRLSRKLNGKNPDQVKFCTIGEGDLIAEYELWQGDKRTDKAVSFAILYAQGGVNTLASIPNDGLANFSCNQQILFTKDNSLYTECYGGNEPSVSKYIYKIDINEGISTKIFQCSSTGINIRGEDNVVCESALVTP